MAARSTVAATRKRPVRRRSLLRGSLLERVPVGLVRREGREVVPASVREEPRQERSPLEPLVSLPIEPEVFPPWCRELLPNGIALIEGAVFPCRLEHAFSSRTLSASG